MRSDLLHDVAELVAKRTGIMFQPSSRGRLMIAVSEEARSRGVSADALAARLDGDVAAFQALLDRITVQETSFFRDPGQFAALASILTSIPEPVTIWSAGCANGQEAYSLGITLAESGIRDWNVIATDISTPALARAKAARYADREILGLSPERRDTYLARAGEGWEVRAPIRDRISIVRHNLVSDAPPFEQGACSIVFCRNVLIYLQRSEVIRFLDRVHDRMADDGFLFLGFSESLWQINDRFRLLRIGDAFVYRPGNDAAAAPVQPPTRSAPPPVSRDEPAGPPDISGLLAIGEEAVQRGDNGAAAAAFRQAAYLDPDHPLAHFQLGLALEALGDERSAQRAFRAAAAAIDTSGSIDAIRGGLGGFGSRDFAQVLDAKLASSR